MQASQNFAKSQIGSRFLRGASSYLFPHGVNSSFINCLV